MTAVDRALAEARTLLVVRLNQGINLLADRDDLLASVKWDAGPTDPPAWFVHTENEAVLHGTRALNGAHPADINPLTPTGRLRHPVPIGLLAHEAAHARHTRWTPTAFAGVPQTVARAAVLLEEPRIERRQLSRRPGDRVYLRAASQLLDLPSPADGSVPATRWHAAQAALLTAGRVDAGVLDASEVKDVLRLCRATLGSDLRKLRAVWRKALELADGDADGLITLAARWVDIVGVDDPTAAPPPPCSRGTAASPSPGPSAGDSGEEPDATEDITEKTPPRAGDGDEGTSPGNGAGEAPGVAALVEAFRSAMESVGERGVEEAAAELGDSEPHALAAATTTARGREDEEDREAAEAMAMAVFHGYSPTGGRDPRGPLRPPTDAERQLARRLADRLRSAQWRERGRIITASESPPGRLLGREAMLAAAQRARRNPVTAKPFRRIVRRETPQPPLTVGIAVDTSGSMRWATAVMATVAWIVAQAVAEIRGRAAAVAFGERVTPITRPGVVPTQVQTFHAGDGAEMFTDAVRALDGALALTGTNGARLLFVVSDGHFVADGEPERAAHAVAHLVRHGVVVLWLNLHRNGEPSGTRVPTGAVSVPVVDIAEVPDQIQKLLVTALQRQ